MMAIGFLIGLMVGGTLGVVVMCCFQLGKESDRHIGGKQENDDKKE